MSVEIPEYERRAREIEARARHEADMIRASGANAIERGVTIGELYDLLGIEAFPRDKGEKKRRKSLVDAVKQLQVAAAGSVRLSEAQTPVSGVSVPDTSSAPRRGVPEADGVVHSPVVDTFDSAGGDYSAGFPTEG